MSVVSSGVVMNMTNQPDDTPVPRFFNCIVYCRRRQIRQQLRLGTFRRRTDRSYAHTEHHRHEPGVHRRYSLLSADGHGPESSPHTYWSVNGDVGRRKLPSHEVESRRVFPRDKHAKNKHNGSDVGGVGGVGGSVAETRLDEKLGDDFEGIRREQAERDSFLERRKSNDDVDDDFDDWSLITWLDVGSAVDCILFWVFLGITIASTTTVLTLFSFQ